MSSTRCECGNIVRTKDGDLPYGGKLVSHAHLEEKIVATRQEIFEFMQAVIAGRRNEWLIKRYGRVIQISDEEILYDSACRHWLSSKDTMEVYQCGQCHRLLIFPGAGQPGLSFMPEQPEGKDLFGAKGL